MFYYYCPINFYYCGKDTFKTENSTEIAPPVFDAKTNTAYFLNNAWEIKKQILTGLFVNKVTYEIKTEIFAEEMNNYVPEADFIEYRKQEVLSEYEEAQKMLLVNGKSVLINIKGQLYRELKIEFSNSQLRIDKMVEIVIQDIHNLKRYILKMPRSFGKFLLKQIQDVSFYNYKQKELFTQKIERNELTLQEIANIKVAFLKNNTININEQASIYCNDNYYKEKFPQDVAYVIESQYHFFTDLKDTINE